MPGVALSLLWLIGFESKNILDARYLVVNRLGRKCIKGLSLIFRLWLGIVCPNQVEG
jgi:hypothetical protein